MARKSSKEYPFEPFSSLARLNRDIIITEKIDGTNAQVIIKSVDEIENSPNNPVDLSKIIATNGDLVMWAGSRTKLIAPGKATDNFGFASFVKENADVLFTLGSGHHYGEWWGKGIQRGYGLPNRFFSLFNAGRWTDGTGKDRQGFSPAEGEDTRELVDNSVILVVPVLYRGRFSESEIKKTLQSLEMRGSQASPGFMDPEGVVVYHTAAGTSFKITVKDDDVSKTEADRRNALAQDAVYQRQADRNDPPA